MTTGSTAVQSVGSSPNSSSNSRNHILAIALIGVLSVMLIPMPVWVLDFLLSTNIMLSLLIVMTVLSTGRPMDFSTFPSVLLFTALFRLSLNVASTRIILIDAQAGRIIDAFGRFVLGGNYVVGTVIFAILVVIQFVVITKGQNRISEVAARFTLDALPGKQMAVDADLNAGLISNEEAKQRRKELASEAEFYGAMDGAGKFVRGDATAGLIITAINIVGGLVMGMVFKNMEFAKAAETYTILTVGDGLVSQIPGLLISVAAGILTTKSANESGLGQQMGDQLLSRPVALRGVAGLLSVIALLPGMPMLPFLGLGGVLFWLSGRVGESETDQEKAGGAGGKSASGEGAGGAGGSEGPASEAPLEDLLCVDRLGIEIGYRLIGLVEPGRTGGLLDHIRAVRRQFAQSLGVVVPPIRVKDNIQIDPNGYRILLNGQVVAKGELRAGHFLAMDPGGLADPIEGLETVEPAFGLPARWIPESEKDRAEVLGYTVIDAPSVLVTHLTEVLKTVAHELLNRDDVKSLVDNLKKTAPAIVEEVIPGQIGLGHLQDILSRLLKERVPIRNLAVVLETVAGAAGESKDPRMLAERVRSALARTIVEPHLDEQGRLHAVVIDPDIERILADAIGGAGGLNELPSGFLAKFVDETATALADMAREGRDPVLITRATLRPFLADAITNVIPNASVLSYQETAPANGVETRSRVAVPA
jgi:flagellar biosynthesis protein FlhA